MKSNHDTPTTTPNNLDTNLDTDPVTMSTGTPTPRTVDPVAMWRELCWIPGTNIAVSGDLHQDHRLAAAQLNDWVDAGITHVVDVRVEWSDEDFVAERAPQLTYIWAGVDDDGQGQSDDWFDSVVPRAVKALRTGDSSAVVHCHMGVNRGPSMAFAILLAMGWEPLAALEAIQTARPIAGIIYAQDALRWWHRHADVPNTLAARQESEVAEWLMTNGVDVGWVISRIRVAEWEAA